MKHTNHDLAPHAALSPELYREAFGPGYQVSGVALRALEHDTLLWSNTPNF